MKLRVEAQGISETVARMAALGGANKLARNDALRDLGGLLKKALKAEARNAAPLSALSARLKRAEGKPATPWGKSDWRAKVTRTGALIVTTRGANKLMEYGGTVTVSEKFRRFAHRLGWHLREQATVRPRPIFGPVYQKNQGTILKYFEERFFYRLGRRMRGWNLGV